MRDVVLICRLERIADLRGVGQRSIERERALERSPLDKLHDQIVRADVVNLANAGMFQRCNCLGFALEALTELQLGNLDGDEAIQTRVAGLVHLTHATRADGRKNFKWAELVAYREGHEEEFSLAAPRADCAWIASSTFTGPIQSASALQKH